MWDSSKISRKWGFSTDKLILGTARRDKGNISMLVSVKHHQIYEKKEYVCNKCCHLTLGIDVIFDVPLRARSLLQVGATGHLHLFPAPE